jgi:hypothetical protein
VTIELRQLLLKAWLETRGRFLAAAAVLSLLGVSTVVRAEGTIAGWEHFHGGEEMPYALYVWLSLSHGYLQFIWIICAIILGLGGLLREHSLGTAGFTLALPVSRRAIVLTRAAVGAAEAVLLALIPELIVALLSPLAGRTYPVAEALLFASLIAGGGLVFYALGFLLSHLLAGEYAAPSAGLAIAAAWYLLTKLPELDPLNVYKLMTGAEYMVGKTYLLGGDYPVLSVTLWLGAGAALIGTSASVASRRAF